MIGCGRYIIPVCRRCYNDHQLLQPLKTNLLNHRRIIINRSSLTIANYITASSASSSGPTTTSNPSWWTCKKLVPKFNRKIAGVDTITSCRFFSSNIAATNKSGTNLLTLSKASHHQQEQQVKAKHLSPKLQQPPSYSTIIKSLLQSISILTPIVFICLLVIKKQILPFYDDNDSDKIQKDERQEEEEEQYLHDEQQYYNKDDNIITLEKEVITIHDSSDKKKSIFSRIATDGMFRNTGCSKRTIHITLIGTKHNCNKSIKQVQHILKSIKPDIVMIELDPTRLPGGGEGESGITSSSCGDDRKSSSLLLDKINDNNINNNKFNLNINDGLLVLPSLQPMTTTEMTNDIMKYLLTKVISLILSIFPNPTEFIVAINESLSLCSTTDVIGNESSDHHHHHHQQERPTTTIILCDQKINITIRRFIELTFYNNNTNFNCDNDISTGNHGNSDSRSGSGLISLYNRFRNILKTVQEQHEHEHEHGHEQQQQGDSCKSSSSSSLLSQLLEEEIKNAITKIKTDSRRRSSDRCGGSSIVVSSLLPTHMLLEQQLPEIYQSIIKERDEYMSNCVNDVINQIIISKNNTSSNTNSSGCSGSNYSKSNTIHIVVIVGLGHVLGITKNLLQQQQQQQQQHHDNSAYNHSNIKVLGCP